MDFGSEDALKRLGDFTIRGKIGEGGMASVLLGRSIHDRSPRLVALKVIKSLFAENAEYLGMFEDEARIVARMQHPAIVRVLERGVHEHRPYLAMEFLDGQSLWQLWAACRERAIRLRYDVLAYIGARVAEGLHHAHEMRDERDRPMLIVHRDVNPSNIFLTYDGRVKVIDFGLAWAKERVSKSQMGIVKGKLAYLAPEQAMGASIDARTDVFALGVSLWELSTDRRLFRVEGDIETLKRVIACSIPNPRGLVADYPPELWRVLQRALTREPEARYPNAAEFAKALDGFVKSSPHPVGPETLEALLGALFANEKQQSAAWLAEAERETSRSTLRPMAVNADKAADMPEIPGPPTVPLNIKVGRDADSLALPSTRYPPIVFAPPVLEEQVAPKRRQPLLVVGLCVGLLLLVSWWLWQIA